MILFNIAHLISEIGIQVIRGLFSIFITGLLAEHTDGLDISAQRNRHARIDPLEFFPD